MTRPVGRPRTDRGRTTRANVTAGFSPAELAAIDQARAIAPAMTRAAFVRQGAVVLAQMRLLKKGR